MLRGYFKDTKRIILIAIQNDIKSTSLLFKSSISTIIDLSIYLLTNIILINDFGISYRSGRIEFTITFHCNFNSIAE